MAHEEDILTLGRKFWAVIPLPKLEPKQSLLKDRRRKGLTFQAAKKELSGAKMGFSLQVVDEHRDMCLRSTQELCPPKGACPPAPEAVSQQDSHLGGRQPHL